MAANYDNSAAFYDSLSGLIFGNALLDAQVYLLQYIKPQSDILIIGGGTGRILSEISKLQPSGLRITYVEISARMMALSRRQNIAGNKVGFVNKAIEDIAAPGMFDVVITPFLLDNYTEQALPATFAHISNMLRPGGIWLYTDFQLTGKWWQYLMLKSMLLFFKILCGVRSWNLPDVSTQFKKYGYTIKYQKAFYSDFIISKYFVKDA